MRKKQNPSAKKVIIVGAGPGGTAAAMLLSHQGYNVEVYEKQPIIGGRTAEIKLGDYRFDLGPTFLMMKYLLDELFVLCGRKTSDYLNCVRLDPMYDLRFKKGSLFVTGNRAKMKSEIERVFPGQGKGLDRFYEREAIRFERMYPCLQKSYSNITSFFSLDLVKALPHLSAGDSLYEVLSNYFEPEELRLAFTFQSKYLGMSPWECPGGFAMIPYTEHAHGIYHVMGGLSEIPKALMKVACEEGAKLYLDTPVKEVLTENGKAVGIVKMDGKRSYADYVIVNADFGHAVNTLFPKHLLRKWTPKTLEKKKFSCSTFMIYLGVDQTFKSEVHTIAFSHDYKKNLEDISKTYTLSEDPSVYVRNVSAIDPSAAPSGHSALYILVPTPNNLSEIDWDQEKSAFRDKILKLIEERTPFKNVRNHIQVEKIITPKDWENEYSVYRGATFNLSHTLTQMLNLRPHNEFEEFENCYLVGGGTHPGSGLPTIFESARIATGMICERDGVHFEKPLSFKDALTGYQSSTPKPEPIHGNKEPVGA